MRYRILRRFVILMIPLMIGAFFFWGFLADFVHRAPGDYHTEVGDIRLRSGEYEAAMKEADENHACEKNYELPDGRKILIGNDRFRAPEILFNPGNANFDLEGVPKYCYDSVMKCDVEVRRDMFANIILAGGSTLFEGMAERMW